MPAVPKIIIKPRLIIPPPQQQSNSGAPTPSSRAEDADDEDNEIPEEEENASNLDDAQSTMDVDGASQTAATPAATADDEGDSRLGTPVQKGRGRPRGRSKGVVSANSTRARGKGRGRGRGRGVGKLAGGLTIKLPKRGEEEVEGATEDGGDGEEAEVKEGTPVEPEPEEGPVGGGKPFRRIQGKAYVIDGDEFVTEDNPKGDEKIDKWGNLLGGRRFKASTFVLPNRHPQRQYLLAIDAARTSGFRDSLYYFRRNALALKLNATQPEKDYLISEGKLGSHLRTRSVTLVTARSAFKLHGSKMIIDGRWVVDDYYEGKMLEEITAKGLKPGDPVGELPDPNAPHHSNELSSLTGGAGAGAGRGERGSGGGIYRAGGPTTIFGGSGWGPYSDGPLNAVRKSLLSRDGVTEENWMYMMAMRVIDAGEEWTKCRKEALKPYSGIDAVGGHDGTMASSFIRAKLKEVEEEEVDAKENVTDPVAKKRKVSYDKDEPPLGVYEPHTGIVQYRTDTQPTRSRWDALPDSVTNKRVLGGTKAGNGAWALAWVDTIMEFPRPGEPDDIAANARRELLQDVANAGDLSDN
ncbi:hypothetical protein AX17_001666 [Amanita inopinata Kibby_2008]|nr:hypothetical protein AX17_001666 [Amanita inopinata Kibby_2008]